MRRSERRRRKRGKIDRGAQNMKNGLRPRKARIQKIGINVEELKQNKKEAQNRERSELELTVIFFVPS
jgi:hypothetical protein